MLSLYAILVYLSIVILPIFPLAVTSNWIEAEFFPTVAIQIKMVSVGKKLTPSIPVKKLIQLALPLLFP